MREAEWVERLWQQISQLANQMVTKEDAQRLEVKLESTAREDTLERLAGKLDTLLINTATKVEVGQVESRLEHLPSREEVHKLENILVDSLPQMVTKQEWSALEARLARTLTREDFSHAIIPLKEGLDSLAQSLSDVTKQINFLGKLVVVSLALDIIALLLIASLLLKIW